MNRLQHKASILAMLLVVAISMLGCTTSRETFMRTAIEVTEERAEFDMKCEEELKSKVFNKNEIPESSTKKVKMNIGVVGCGRNATYYTECKIKPNWNLSRGADCTPILNNITNNIDINININEGNASNKGDEQ